MLLNPDDFHLYSAGYFGGGGGLRNVLVQILKKNSLQKPLQKIAAASWGDLLF